MLGFELGIWLFCVILEIVLGDWCFRLVGWVGLPVFAPQDLVCLVRVCFGFECGS